MTLLRLGALLYLIGMVLILTTLLSGLGLVFLTMLGLHDGSVPNSLGYPLIAAGASILLGGLSAVASLVIGVWRGKL